MNLRTGTEVLNGLLLGALVYASYQLMSEYTVFLVIGLFHVYFIPAKNMKPHAVAALAYIVSLLIIQPHNYYFVLFLAIVYFMDWALKKTKALHIRALICVLVAGLLAMQLHWVLMSAIHLNRVLDGTYINYLTTKN